MVWGTTKCEMEKPQKYRKISSLVDEQNDKQWETENACWIIIVIAKNQNTILFQAHQIKMITQSLNNVNILHMVRIIDMW